MNLLGEEGDSPPPLFMNRIESNRSRESQREPDEVHRFRNCALS